MSTYHVTPVEADDGRRLWRLMGPGVKSEAKPSDEWRAKLEDLAVLLNAARQAWEQERQSK